MSRNVASTLFMLMMIGTISSGLTDAYLYSSASSLSSEDIFCWKKSFGRGAGVIPDNCPDDKPNKQAGLCYKSCPSGYKAVGPVCWKGLKAKGRGAGTIPSKCDDGYEKDAGLCYKNCKATFYGVGPVCWKKCSGLTPTNCGAACASSAAACVNSITDKASACIQALSNIIELFGTGGSSALLEASVEQVTTTMAVQAAYEIACQFKQKGYSQSTYISYMLAGASRLNTSLSTAALTTLYGKASASEIITLAASVISTVDPTGLADVVVAFANSSC